MPHPATIIAYTYEGDIHCCQCAQKRFGAALDDGTAQDGEGNPVHPVFAGDEICEIHETCANCGEYVYEV